MLMLKQQFLLSLSLYISMHVKTLIRETRSKHLTLTEISINSKLPPTMCVFVVPQNQKVVTQNYVIYDRHSLSDQQKLNFKFS